MRAAVLAALIAFLVLDAGAALAHRLNLFAYAEDGTIVGSAYFSGGGAPAGADVTVYGPDGAVLGQTTTDRDGAFAFDVAVRTDHRIAVETADGHAAEFVVAAAELPASLPLGEGAALASAGADDAASQQAAAAPAQGATAQGATAQGAAADAAIDDAALEAMIARAVQQQVRPLRQQLAAYGEEIRLRDILGGIGYILGIFGLAAYAMALRRRAAQGAAAAGTTATGTATTGTAAAGTAAAGTAAE